MKLVTLKSICRISFGYHGRPKDDGPIKYLQLNNFDKHGSFVKSDYLDYFKNYSSFLISKGDIIVPAKGRSTFAWLYEESMGLTVASSSFFVLRSNPEIVQANYLCAILNSQEIENEYKRSSVGTDISTIKKEDFANLSIPIPSFDLQSKYALIYQLQKQEANLVKELLKNKMRLNTLVLRRLIQ